MYQTILYMIIYTVSALLLYVRYSDILNVFPTTIPKSQEIIVIINYIAMYGYIIHIMKLLRRINNYAIKRYLFLKLLFVFANVVILILIIYTSIIHIYDCIQISCLDDNKLDDNKPDSNNLELFGIILSSILLSQYFVHILYPLNKCMRENQDREYNPNPNIIQAQNQAHEPDQDINMTQYKKIRTILIFFTAILSYNIWVPIIVRISDLYVIIYQILIISLIIFIFHSIAVLRIRSFQHIYVWSVCIILYLVTIGYSFAFIYLHPITYMLIPVNLVLLLSNIIICAYVYLEIRCSIRASNLQNLELEPGLDLENPNLNNNQNHNLNHNIDIASLEVSPMSSKYNENENENNNERELVYLPV